MGAQWISRCLPAFSVLTLVVLLVLATDTAVLPWKGAHTPAPDTTTRHEPLTGAQNVFVVYTVLIHANIFLFTVRLAWSLVAVPFRTQRVLDRRASPIHSYASRSASETSLDGPPSPTTSSGLSACEEDSLMDDETTSEIIHAIILPNYSEDIDTLRMTLGVLASHPRAGGQYEVYLAMEQKEIGCTEKAVRLVSEFEKSFLRISTTFHPPGVPGEIPGKSSNVAFAARHIADVHQAGLNEGISNVVITVMDADTHLLQDYFTEIRRLHYAHPADADRAIYSCPIIFDRNSHETPLLVRCADLLWGFAGLSTMYPGSSISIPTSVYSLPLSLAEQVGGWDSDATAIGEDMHMMLKCYFETTGNVISRVVFSPASQCNISSDLKRGWRWTLDTCLARYRQALRHMWGALDSGFAARQTVSHLRRINRRWLFLLPRHLALLQLLFEAHFLPCHLIILILYSTAYEALSPAGSLHPSMAWAFWSTGLLRASSFVGMNVCLVLYERWHALCLRIRRNDMLDAGLADCGFSPRCWWHVSFLLERVCFPIAGTLYGAIPTFQAVFSHLWTDRLEYRVSKKPVFGEKCV